MLLNVNKAQLAIIFEALASQGYTEETKMLKSMAEGYSEAGTPVTASELSMHHGILLECLSEHVEVEEGQWNWVNEDVLIDCCHDEDGEEF